MTRSSTHRGWIRRHAPALLGALVAACGGGSGSDEAAQPVPEGAHPLKQPPPNVVGSFAIDVPPFTLAPGDEKMPCTIFPLVIDGPSRVVGGAKLTVGRGMHHGNITTRKKTGEGVRTCPNETGDDVVGSEAVDIIGGGAVLFGSSTQFAGEEWQSFPEGVGYRLKEGYEVVARMHYLNATAAPLTVAPRYEWYTIDETKLTHEIAPFAWVYKELAIPPKSELTVTSAACTFTNPMNVVMVLPHMHKFGTGFHAAFAGGPRDGQHFLDSKGYDPDNGVMTQYSPAIDLSQHGADGAGATFSCSWRNPLDKGLVWGVGDNEMCVMYGYAYPPSAAYSVLASAQGCIVALP
ncbi:MAG TPA: hypothetical protein VLT33_02090 [Labilithrix sp.]|nr:hypothetical protein [Labilithrix sp.]